MGSEQALVDKSLAAKKQTDWSAVASAKPNADDDDDDDESDAGSHDEASSEQAKEVPVAPLKNKKNVKLIESDDEDEEPKKQVAKTKLEALRRKKNQSLLITHFSL